MLVSSNNDVSLRKAFEELSISSQVNCGFYNKNEKIKTSEPIETEWTDDEEDYPPIEYANRVDPIQSMIYMVDELNICMPLFYGPPTVPYLEERDKDISSDEDEEKALRFKRYSEAINAFWAYKANGINATEPPFALFENLNAIFSYLDNTFPDDNEGFKWCYE